MPPRKKRAYTEEDEESVYLYNTIFSKKKTCRKLGGKWDRDNKRWVFVKESLDVPVESLVEMYNDAGYDPGTRAYEMTEWKKKRERERRASELRVKHREEVRGEQRKVARQQLATLSGTDEVVSYRLKPDDVHSDFVAYTGPKEQLDKIYAQGNLWNLGRSEDGRVFICVHNTAD